jgi:phytoene dehydrogenase-like protein
MERAGAPVVVLESREHVGGATETSRPRPELPGRRVGTHSCVVSLMSPAVVADLALERHGRLAGRAKGPALPGTTRVR